ncbi:MAG: GDP-mannose 4,6-dehydratase [Gemmatimonadaceae bacterium]|nr:GDP-mannose 4,6-dehydratase [Gemmatimonadaceae bacterium]
MTTPSTSAIRRALVTGGAGFIGSHVVEALVARRVEVTVADNLSTGHMENLDAVAGQILYETLDIARDDIDPLLGSGAFDTIIHAAGNAHIPSSIDDPGRDLEDNIVSTHNLLAAVRRVSPHSRVVNISSATVYGEGSGVPINEDEPTRPVSPYGVSKLAAELYVALYARLFGLRTCTVRLFSVFGPRLRKQVIWDFMNKLAANPHELVILGDGGERRDLNHVRNVVHAILLVAERSPLTGDVFNVAARESVSIDEAARSLSAAMGIAPIFRHTGEQQAGNARSWQADISRIEALGYRPEMGYQDGLADTVAWFRRLQSHQRPGGLTTGMTG